MKIIIIMVLIGCLTGCVHPIASESSPIKTGMSVREVKTILGRPSGTAMDMWSLPVEGDTNKIRSTSMLVWKLPPKEEGQKATEYLVHIEKVHPSTEKPGNPYLESEESDQGWTVESIKIKQ